MPGVHGWAICPTGCSGVQQARLAARCGFHDCRPVARGGDGIFFPFLLSLLPHFSISFLSLPSISSPCFPFSFSYLLFPQKLDLLNSARRSRERSELPQRGLVRSPSRNRIWCTLTLNMTSGGNIFNQKAVVGRRCLRQGKTIRQVTSPSSLCQRFPYALFNAMVTKISK